MNVRRAATWACVVGVAAGVGGCGGFDELRDRAWVDSSGTPDGIDGDFPIALAALSTDLPGLHAVALAGSPLGIATISYDASGSIESSGIAVEGAGDGGQPTVVAATDPVVDSDGAVVVGGAGAGDALFLYDAHTGAVGPELRRVIHASDCAAGLTPMVSTWCTRGPTSAIHRRADLMVSAG